MKSLINLVPNLLIKGVEKIKSVYDVIDVYTSPFKDVEIASEQLGRFAEDVERNLRIYKRGNLSQQSL